MALIRYLLFATLIAWTAHAQELAPFPALQASDRIAIIAPHPDDEVLGTGGLIQQAVAIGAKVRVIYLTNGDHNQFAFRLYSRRMHLGAPDCLTFGEQRRNEAIAATKLLGLTADDLVFLGYPDWNTMRIWRDFWEPGQVLSNDTTRSYAVPYPEDFSYRHQYCASNVVADLSAVLREFQPTRVLATHPCDTNPDHRAAANYARLALLELEPEGLHPSLNFFIVHYGNWPSPLHYHPDLKLEPPSTLTEKDRWMSLPLTQAQIETEHSATLTNQTQVAFDQAFLESFERANEVFARFSTPTVPVVTTGEQVDWSKGARLPSLSLLPSEFGYEPDGISSLPASSKLMELDYLDFLRQNDSLLTLVSLKNLAGQRTGVDLYLYGYKQGRDFASLPKVQITISPQGELTVTVNNHIVANHGVTLTSDGPQMILRIPMQLLGGRDLDHVFTSALAHLGDAPADDTAWELLRLLPAVKI